jgi:hypothetical protein
MTKLVIEIGFFYTSFKRMQIWTPQEDDQLPEKSCWSNGPDKVVLIRFPDSLLRYPM